MLAKRTRDVEKRPDRSILLAFNQGRNRDLGTNRLALTRRPRPVIIPAPRGNTPMNRVLVIQLRELGDSLLTTPAIRQLKQSYPHATIDVVCEPRTEQIFRHHPHVGERFLLRRGAKASEFLQLAWRLSRRRYDLIVDAQSLPKTAALSRLIGAPRRVGFRRRWLCNRSCYTHPFGHYVPAYGNFVRPAPGDGWLAEYAALSKLRLLQDERIDLADLALDFHIGDDERDQAKRFRHRCFRGPVAAIYGVSRWPHRRWPAEKFGQLGDRLIASGYQIFLACGPGEEAATRQLASHIRGDVVVHDTRMSFATFKGILDGCGLYVGVDGGPKHVAAACGIPTVTLFGITHPEIWTSPHASQKFVATASDSRSLPTLGKCTDSKELKDISVDEVWSAVEDAITYVGRIGPSVADVAVPIESARMGNPSCALDGLPIRWPSSLRTPT